MGGEKLNVTWAKRDRQVELLLLRLPMPCSQSLAAALRDVSVDEHELLIYRAKPLGSNVETCGCEFDAEIIFDLGAGEHRVDVYSWSRWGEEPRLQASADVKM